MADGRSWHAMSVEEVMSVLGTSPQGLSSDEASRRLEIYGPNAIGELRRLSVPRLLFRQFNNALNYILSVAVIISLATGHFLDGIVIVAIILINAFLGFAQEYRSEKALEAIKQLSAPKANVIRDNIMLNVNVEDVVPGDIVVLEAGDIVPADMRVVTSIRLHVEQAILTGEPGSEIKFSSPLPEDTPLVDRHNMLYAGTTVTEGRGYGVVVATGMNTEIGKIAKDVSEAGEAKTPLQRKISKLAVQLSAAAAMACAILGVLALLRGVGVYESLMFALAAAVSAIPEGLILVVTLALVVGVRLMAKRNAIIRRLQAVETLGSATVICTDKTGTLTRNEMTVRTIYLNGELIDVTGEGYTPVGEFLRSGEAINPKEHVHLQLFLKTMALCSNAHLCEEPDGRCRIMGDPTEGALVVAAAKAGINKEREEEEAPRIEEIPFDPRRACMTTIHRLPDGKIAIYTKGAPERVLELCSEIYVNGSTSQMTYEARASILEASRELALRGYRVLGGAYKILDSPDYRMPIDACGENLVFLGLAGIQDPPRKEAAEAVGKCKQAGIRVIMITGDHKETAKVIAKEVGIADMDDQALEGKDLDGVSDEELEKIVGSVNVFARVEPRHKLRIVRALKKQGHIVAMTGDGVNDAPALKEADIGVAMGITGTQIAKETSDMVLADDNFATIVAAVEEGRTVFDNMRKTVTYLVTTSIAEIIFLFSCLVIGLPLPFLPLQILWINMVTDGICDKTLAVDPRDRDVLKEPPRPPEEGIIIRGVVYRILFLSLIMAFGTLLIYYCSARSLEPLTFIYGYEEPRTMAFCTMVFFQLFNALNMRSNDQSLFKVGVLSNKYLAIAVFVSFLLNISIVYVPFFQELFQVTPLSILSWLLVFLTSGSVLIAEEARKKMFPTLFSKR
ncbi:MAG: HAD-IC family P-type ATPase [Candidatus Jordarchaeales archaeon]|nr:HAD-IC family P-type ATPase [Candidatus Jordarchaeia archaeon]